MAPSDVKGTTVLVVSDLHLGGAEDFQMCSSAGQARLAEFLAWVPAQRLQGRDLRLVLAGDVVDFLAEEDEGGGWSAFTADERAADGKLARILERTAPVWKALARCISEDVAVTVLLGNHDVELALPRPRRRFLDAIAAAGGRVEFLYDGEAFTAGDLLVEHGNRYEGWNKVDHDALRALRSRLSHGEAPQAFPPQPGSRLVADVMNPLKKRFAFVDLLKPETGGVLPIIAVLDPSAWLQARSGVASGLRAAWRHLRRDERGMPTGPYIGTDSASSDAAGDGRLGAAGSAAPPPERLPDEDAFALADDLAKAGATSEIGFARDVSVDLLLRAFRKRAEKDGVTFRVDDEAGTYRGPAEELARNGFKVIVFGHSHHVKRVALDRATYLNTGTWADLMRIPSAVYEGDDAAGCAALGAFLQDLEDNRIERFRRQVPTFARVELDGRDRVETADVFFFDDGGKVVEVTTDGVLERLGFAPGKARGGP